jgi:hypothetical protein
MPVRECANTTCRNKLAQSNPNETCYACITKERDRKFGGTGLRNPRPMRCPACGLLSHPGRCGGTLPAPKDKTLATVAPQYSHGRQSERVLRAIAGGCRSSVEVSRITGIPAQSCSAALSALRSAKKIRQVGLVGKTIHWEVAQPSEPAQISKEVPTEIKALVVEPTSHYTRMIGRNRMDTLVSTTMKIEELPPEVSAAPPPKRRVGRLGELWNKLQANPKGMMEVVESRDRNHATQTVMHMRKKAKAAGRELNERRDVTGVTLYVWLSDQEK